MIKRRLFLIGIISLVFATVISCTTPNEADPKADPTKAVTTVGTILGLTGENASYGQKMQRGFEFALSEAELSGNLQGPKVKLVIEDSQFDPAKAVSAYRKLTGTQNVHIIVGITGSKNALPVCEAAKTESILIVDALSSAPKISTQCGENYFRVMASDSLAGQYNVDWAIESGMKKPAIVYMEDDWGASYRDTIQRYLSKKNFNNFPMNGVVEGTRDFRAIVEKLKAAEPDAIFILLYPKEGAAFMQQLRQAGVKALAYGSDNLSSPEFIAAGSQVIEGVRVALPAPTQGPAYEEFVKKYKAKYGEDPDAILIKSFDAMALVATVIQKVGDDPMKIRDYLKLPSFEYQGVSGLIKFDENGDLVSQQYTRQVYNSGKLVPV